MHLVSKTYSSAELAYREVKERILTGALPGGELISEGEIAGALGMSRTPVREAFLRLEAEGWMKLYPKRGALVVPVPVAEAEHVVHARYVVEVAAVRALAAADRTALTAELHSSLHRQREVAATGDREAFASADTDFHRAYVVAGGNPLLTGFYDSLRERQRRMNSLALRRGNSEMGQIIDQHADLADLVTAGEPERFAEALVAHLSGVHRLELRGL